MNIVEIDNTSSQHLAIASLIALSVSRSFSALCSWLPKSLQTIQKDWLVVVVTELRSQSQVTQLNERCDVFHSQHGHAGVEVTLGTETYSFFLFCMQNYIIYKGSCRWSSCLRLKPNNQSRPSYTQCLKSWVIFIQSPKIALHLRSSHCKPARHRSSPSPCQPSSWCSMVKASTGDQRVTDIRFRVRLSEMLRARRSAQKIELFRSAMTACSITSNKF